MRGRRFCNKNEGSEIFHKNGDRHFSQKIGVGDFAQKREGSYFVKEIWGSENLEKKNEGSEILQK